MEETHKLITVFVIGLFVLGLIRFIFTPHPEKAEDVIFVADYGIPFDNPNSSLGGAGAWSLDADFAPGDRNSFYYEASDPNTVYIPSVATSSGTRLE